MNTHVESGSTFTLNASRSYNLLCFIGARKACQMLLRNLRKIYATVEIHLKINDATAATKPQHLHI